MKKLVFVGLITLLLFSLTACGNSDISSLSGKSDLKIGLVVGISGIDDRSYNQGAWEGIVQYAQKNNLSESNYSYSHSLTENDYVDDLANYADQKMDLIIAPGYYFDKPIKMVSKKYPEQKFLLIDTICEGGTIACATFADNEGGFLAGIAAALKAQDMGWNKVGMLGGIDMDLIQRFEAGYTKGVHMIDPEMEVVVMFAGDFSNPRIGEEIASQMYEQGVHIIFNVAGSTGNGLINECVRRAAEGEDVWVVGVDKDQYEDGIYAEGKSCVLTSMLKHLDVATYDTINAVKNGEFKAGHKIYGLKDKGVGIPENNPNLKDEWVTKINEFKNDVVEDKIVVPLIPDRVKNND